MEGQAFQIIGAQFFHGAADVGDTFLCGVADFVELTFGDVGRDFQSHNASVESGGDARERVAERVMNFARQAIAFAGLSHLLHFDCIRAESLVCLL